MPGTVRGWFAVNLWLVWGARDLKVSTAVRTYEVIERIDAFCDAVPRRRARANEYGPLVLFVPTGPGWPYYARPRRGPRPRITAADIRAVRAYPVRQRSARLAVTGFSARPAGKVGWPTGPGTLR